MKRSRTSSPVTVTGDQEESTTSIPKGYGATAMK